MGGGGEGGGVRLDERKLPRQCWLQREEGWSGKLALCSQGDAFIHFGCAAGKNSCSMTVTLPANHIASLPLTLQWKVTN